MIFCFQSTYHSLHKRHLLSSTRFHPSGKIGLTGCVAALIAHAVVNILYTMLIRVHNFTGGRSKWPDTPLLGIIVELRPLRPWARYRFRNHTVHFLGAAGTRQGSFYNAEDVLSVVHPHFHYPLSCTTCSHYIPIRSKQVVAQLLSVTLGYIQ